MPRNISRNDFPEVLSTSSLHYSECTEVIPKISEALLRKCLFSDIRNSRWTNHVNKVHVSMSVFTSWTKIASLEILRGQAILIVQNTQLQTMILHFPEYTPVNKTASWGDILHEENIS
jgi:hypothetical protein